MSRRRPPILRLRALAVPLLGVLAGLVLGGCGDPAVIKPAATPLPGFKRDIQAARNAVTRAEREATSDAGASAGGS